MGTIRIVPCLLAVWLLQLIPAQGAASKSEVCGQPMITGRIVGGHAATNGAWPWQVNIFHSYYFICGGALIDKEWVLSAAHCFYNATNPDEYLLVFGAYQLLNISNVVVVKRVKRIILHYDYNGIYGSSGDVALLQLSSPVDFTNNILPVCLPESSAEFYANTNCWVTGWGNTQYDVPLEDPMTLQEVNVPLIKRETCNIYYNRSPIQDLSWNPVKANMFCAGYEMGGKGPCQGDSGGPLVCKEQGSWFQAGIVSWGIGCALRNFPAVYTSVPYYAKWISAGLEGRDPNSAGLEGAASSSVVCGQPVISGRIVGGHAATSGEWPWQVSVLRSTYFICGGSLIDKEWVLSAAHCFYNATKPDEYRLLFGAYQLLNLSNDVVVKRVKRIILHYDYNGIYDSSGDVALLQLTSPVDFANNILPVCLPGSSAEFYANTNCWVTGWGNTQYKVPLKDPMTLQEVNVPLIKRETCNIYYNRVPTQGLNWNPVKADMFCAGYEMGGKDSCQGDSGGPLVCKVQGSWFQAGIVSWGVGCALRNYPGIYTSVPYYAKWISAGLEGSDPNSAGLEVSNPNSAGSEGGDPNSVGSEGGDPNSAGSEGSDPNSAGSEGSDPNSAGTESSDPNSAGSDGSSDPNSGSQNAPLLAILVYLLLLTLI